MQLHQECRADRERGERDKKGEREERRKRERGRREREREKRESEREDRGERIEEEGERERERERERRERERERERERGGERERDLIFNHIFINYTTSGIIYKMHIITQILQQIAKCHFQSNTKYFLHSKLFQFLHMRVENKIVFYSSFYESFEQQFNIFTTAIGNLYFLLI